MIIINEIKIIKLLLWSILINTQVRIANAKAQKWFEGLQFSTVHLVPILRHGQVLSAALPIFVCKFWYILWIYSTLFCFDSFVRLPG